jgi:hypothetical protein
MRRRDPEQLSQLSRRVLNLVGGQPAGHRNEPSAAGIWLLMAGGRPMADNTLETRKQQLDAIRQRRELLLRQIQESQKIIERSRELLRWMDDLLAREENPEP